MRTLLLVLACLPVGLAGCAHGLFGRPLGVADLTAAQLASWGDAVRVPGNRAWTETGVHVKRGEVVTLAATGTIRADNDWEASRVGPEGTYHYANDVVAEPFPLPSTADGPAPCYGLIARIGDGPPVPVGTRRSWIADRDGPIVLGVNDFDVDDNAGEWLVRVGTGGEVQPVFRESVVDQRVADGRPVRGASAVVFYVDGLRPDVVREMAALGHLPNINRLFLEGGAWFEHAFTAFPSDTITSNGTMWTGVFSDRHGLKGQVRFSRRTLQSDSYLEPLGPNRSARLLGPTGLDRFLHDGRVESVRLFAGDDAAEQYDRGRTTRAQPLYERLAETTGKSWATGILPVMTETPPLLWTKSLTRYLPYLQPPRASRYIDDANSHFARRHLLARESPVTVVWLPETDTISHEESRGQFGLTRRTIARADRLIGEVVDEIADTGRAHSTYLILVSDHGHHGGRSSHLVHYDLANELLFAPREIDEDGQWVGGGLGLSVRQHRFWNRHRGDKSRRFVFVDGENDGAARLFLPRNDYTSGDWSAPSDPAALLAYRVAEHLPPINLVETLAGPTSRNGNGRIERPVDLVMFKLAENAIAVVNADRGAAVIDRVRNDTDDGWRLRYRVVTNLRPRDDGGVDFDVVPNPTTDPLRILELPGGDRALGRYGSEREWLRATARSVYPDSVVALTRHLLWDDAIDEREREYAPDLVVTATAGWYFGRASSPGTMHGYPLADAVRASLFVHGPNVRRGARIADPARLVDLTPTLLDMVGALDETNRDEFDGRPLRTIYRPAESFARGQSPDATPQWRDLAGADAYTTREPWDDVPRESVHWSDVDLNAWSGIAYQPLEPYEHLPFEVNRPKSPYDVNNVAYSLITLTDLNVLRLLDDLFLPINRGSQPATRSVEWAEDRLRVLGGPLGEAVQALNAGETTLGDYTWTSLGNLKRMDGAVDWLQGRTRDVEEVIVAPLGTDHLPGSRLVHGTVDSTQAVVWEAYRFTQRIVAQVVDETILNGIEDGAARSINSFGRVPAEVRVARTTVRAQSMDPRPRRTDTYPSVREDRSPTLLSARTDRYPSYADPHPLQLAMGDDPNPRRAPDDHPLTADERDAIRRKHEAIVANATKRIEANADDVAAHSARGDALFFLGRFDASLRDYERMVELNPRLGDSHWRRGIARFYAEKFKEAAKQFEDYHTFDNVDRENGIWRYLSQHRAHGRKKAREGLLKYEKTDREPFPDVYKLYAGDIEPAAILERIAKADLEDDQRESRYFYAHLYIGLNHAVEGREKEAVKHLRLATANDWAPTAGFGPTWMWHVGRVHHDLLKAKLAEKKPE